MPLVGPALSQIMLSKMRSNVKKISDDAVPTDFQQELAIACGTGIVQIMQTVAIGVGGVGTTATGNGNGITGTSGSAMSAVAKSYLQSQTGYPPGIGFDPIMDGILGSASDYLSNATVVSISGFGGQATKITGWSPGQLAQLILAAFSAESQARIKSSQAGMQFIAAIANGFTTNIQASGIPGPVPQGSPPPGALIAKFL